MKTLLVRLAWGTVMTVLVVALTLGAFLVWGLPELLPPGSAIVLDGERFELGDLARAHPGHWLMASMGILIAAALTVIVVPLAIVLAVALPLLLGVFAVAVAMFALALVVSPLILLLWWLFKAPKRTTIPA